jgi:hypothetical protein
MSVFARALFALILGAGLLLGAAGCDNNSEENPALLRVVHAVPGLDAIDFFIDFELFTRNLTFRNGSLYNRWDPGLRQFEVRPAGNSQNALITQEVIIDEESIATILVTGSASTPSLLMLDDDRSTPPAGEARLRVVHAAPTFSNLDVVVTETGGGALDLSVSGFGQTSTFVSTPAGTYAIEARPTDGSGSLTLPAQPLESGLRYLIVVTNTAVFTVADG